MTATLTMGIGTFRAIEKLFAGAAELTEMDHPEDRAIGGAQLVFLRTATITKWKAYVPVPEDAGTRALLVEEFTHLANTRALLPEFETHSYKQMIRGAFARLAQEMK